MIPEAGAILERNIPSGMEVVGGRKEGNVSSKLVPVLLVLVSTLV